MKNFIILAAVLCCKIASASPDSAKLYFQKGMEEKEARRYLVSHNHFTKAISFDPAYTDAYLQDALVALEMRKTDLAITQFTKVMELNPGNPQAIKELTDLYYSYRQYPKAIELAKKCSDCPTGNKIIGMSYYKMEDYTQAIKYLNLAIKQDATDAEAQYTLGRTYLDIEDYKKAVPYYLTAIKLSPEKNAWSNELGLLYYNVGDFKNASKMFEAAVANGYIAGNDFKENLGFSYLYAGDYQKGEDMILDVWKKKPGNTQLIREMADVMYQQKQYDLSLKYCQLLMEKNDKDSKALYQAGLNFIKKGQKDRGQQMCDKAIEMDPSLQSLRQKKEMMGL